MMDALKRAKRAMLAYEETRGRTDLPVEAIDVVCERLLRQAEIYAAIATAQELRAASNRAGDYTSTGADEEYRP